LVEFKQARVSDIIESERQMVLSAPERAGNREPGTVNKAGGEGAQKKLNTPAAVRRAPAGAGENRDETHGRDHGRGRKAHLIAETRKERR
jgi:hypothetical protein